MANKISIALTPCNSIIINIPKREEISDINRVSRWLSDFIDQQLLIYVTAFMFLFPSIIISGFGSLMIIIYATTLLVLLNRILRKLFLKGEHFPTVPFDLALLTMTTFISFSFFYNTAIAQVNTNIWGGITLQEISGVSLISYWFYYYLLFTSIRSKNDLTRLMKAFYLSPLIALLGVLIFNLQLSHSVFLIIMLFHPMYLYLSLNSKKNIKLHLFNLLISSFFLSTNTNKWVSFIIFIFYLLQIIYLIISNRKVLPILFTNLDKGLSLKTIGRYIRNNSTIIILLLSMIIVFLGSNSIYTNIKQTDFIALEKGYSQLSKLTGLELLLGVGLRVFESPKFIQFLLSYGLLTGLVMIVVKIGIIRQLRNIYQNIHDKSIKKLLTSLIIGMIPVLSLLFFSNADTQLIPLTLITMGSIYLLIKKIIMDKYEDMFFLEKTGNKILKANQSYFLGVMKILLIIIFLLGFIYLLSYLNYINIFINT